MGNCKSRVKSDEIQIIKEQIQTLMQKESRVITHETIIKSEFNELKHRFEKLEEDVEKKVSMKYANLISDKDSQINELSKQIESLKSINYGLELKSKDIDMNQTINLNNKINDLSKAKIDKFVEKLLADNNVNIKYLPDFVERAIYKNILNLIIGLLNNTLNTFSINFLGHHMTINVVPDKTIDRINIQQRDIDLEQEVKKELELEEALEKEIDDYIEQSIKSI
ncbi:hypothetical protein Indivirus_1_212 [Indivirus ILV1]|uniref:Uncharacterized protein n=1 Tax=Indivirus ILV1 TaxID=1977633 RepID=A0A1V0SD01_9VIRU|nr:hypothetical protein Indivirus_1_212 [Indivirus ILV1]